MSGRCVKCNNESDGTTCIQCGGDFLIKDEEREWDSDDDPVDRTDETRTDEEQQRDADEHENRRLNMPSHAEVRRRMRHGHI